ncbi:decapping and exoribonuclease protein-like [Sycon ciliatum]|uniref:decapping and exoribonuclease protein-like n=1 Tax=Sycon ciliatum TaxID=27933 RepID=UPI0031F6A05E
MAHPAVMEQFSNTNFVLKRGVMTDIMTAPYESKSNFPKEWRLKVCRHRNTIYLCNDAEFPQWKSFSSASPREQQTTHWGFRFESYCTAPVNPEAEVNSKPNDTAGFDTVVYTQLADHSFILAAEVDGELDRPGLSPPSNYVEMKTHRNLRTAYHTEMFHRHKLFRTWAQCHCIGVPDILDFFDWLWGSIEEADPLQV